MIPEIVLVILLWECLGGEVLVTWAIPALCVAVQGRSQEMTGLSSTDKS